MRTTIQNDTAILLFANSAEKDFARKNFSAKAVSLFQDLTEHTLKTIASTGIPFFHFTEKEQQGDTFGERFSHALESVYAMGFTKVISVGNDSPNLTVQHILQAQAQVSKNKSVVGPTLDGGFYLLGLHKDMFQKELFETLPWQSAALYQQLLLQLKQQDIGLEFLDALNDIDSLADIKRLSNYIKTLSAHWIGLFSSIASYRKSISEVIASFFEALHFQIPFNKGSPSFS